MIAVGLLVYLLGFLIFKGAGAINIDFLTQEAAPVGETGGGILVPFWVRL